MIAVRLLLGILILAVLVADYIGVAAVSELGPEPVAEVRVERSIPPQSSTTSTTGGIAAHVRVVPSPPAPSRHLRMIRECESNGDYRAVSKSGRYKGGYQADDETWGGYGGYSSADQAPPSVQDEWAEQLYRRRGAAPWPVCGRA